MSVPQEVTREALAADTSHWPDAAKELAGHEAHIAVAASVDQENAICLAVNMTKCVSSLLFVLDSPGVGWLNGPVLNSGKDFVGIAAEMCSTEALPLMLWVAALWNAKARLIHTKGMSQFDAPELLLAQQPGPSIEVVAYLFDLASYVLTSGNLLLDGETIDGPKGTLRIESVKSESEKRGLMLFPIQPN